MGALPHNRPACSDQPMRQVHLEILLLLLRRPRRLLRCSAKARRSLRHRHRLSSNPPSLPFLGRLRLVPDRLKDEFRPRPLSQRSSTACWSVGRSDRYLLRVKMAAATLRTSLVCSWVLMISGERQENWVRRETKTPNRLAPRRKLAFSRLFTIVVC